MASNTGPVTIKVSRWTEDGIVFETIDLTKVIGVTVIDGDRALTYDYETGNLTLAVGNGRDVPVDAPDLEKEPVTPSGARG